MSHTKAVRICIRTSPVNPITSSCLMTFLIPKDKGLEALAKSPAAWSPSSASPTPSAFLLEIQASQGQLEAQLPAHLRVSSIPNTCVKRSRSRMRP